ncbi:hypothetical protein MKY98_12955 [Paenibacillus sp. FSL M8-0228]|uniref:hypothetical protein n=1 Tax=Paenibacillus TaxID=44249 RepID=UPI00083D0C4A|nr:MULTISPECIES: hypothetical protein [Paenibacillus]MBO3287202.1 hypothetical protein [Paenibacillus polymyxa]ODB53449.1 hypothetical protein A7311_23665 [Paenibacillus polymyxa]
MSGTNRRVESLVIVDPEGNLQPFHFIDHYRENDQFYCILRHYNEIKIFKLVEKDGESVLFMAPLCDDDSTVVPTEYKIAGISFDALTTDSQLSCKFQVSQNGKSINIQEYL